LLKAQFIHLVGHEQQSILKDVRGQLTEADAHLATLRRALTIQLIQSAGDELMRFGERVAEISRLSEGARKQLGPVLYADHQISPSEAQILNACSTRSDIDLTDLFVTLRQAGQATDLSALLSEIESLYRKNRVIVRIRPRG
jgi:hypothetical protein